MFTEAVAFLKETARPLISPVLLNSDLMQPKSLSWRQRVNSLRAVPVISLSNVLTFNAWPLTFYPKHRFYTASPVISYFFIFLFLSTDPQRLE